MTLGRESMDHIRRGWIKTSSQAGPPNVPTTSQGIANRRAAVDKKQNLGRGRKEGTEDSFHLHSVTAAASSFSSSRMWIRTSETMSFPRN